MSKAAWAGLLLTGAGLGMVAFLLTAGLPSDAQTVAELSKNAAAKNADVVEQTKAEFNDIVQSEAELLAALPEIAKARTLFEARQSALKAKRTALEPKLDALLERNKHSDAAAVQALGYELTMAANQAISGIRIPIATANRFRGYKTKFNEIMTTARDDLRLAKSVSEGLEFGQLQAAMSAYPEVREKLSARQAAALTQAATILQQGAQLGARSGLDPPDYIGAGRIAEKISGDSNALRKLIADLKRDIGQLSTSIDKVLIDMKSDGGRYSHKYRIIENGASRETGWEDVTMSFYQQHRDNLGMTIYSKPEGVLESEAIKTAVPPGYNYVGNPRYGRWEDRGGTSFWVFYGRYALMRDLFWGRGHYRPVNRRTYQSYRSQRKLGRAWYGPNREYGTKGTKTRVKYASSTHYKRRNSYSSGGYSGGSRSGSRSGGSRRGRYRGSSFGGFGK